MIRNTLAFTSLVLASGSCLAACFQANPMVPPSSDVAVYTGEKPDSLRGFGEAPFGSVRSPYPPAAPVGITSQEKKKIDSASESVELWYYEPSPQSKLPRVCRVDLWVPRQNPDQVTQIFEQLAHHSKGNSLSSSLLKQNMTMLYSTTYSYDSKGRIETILENDLSKDLPVKTVAKHCSRYDESDNLVLWVNPKNTKKCPQGEPSAKDEWRQYKYGSFEGKQIELRSRWHIPKENDRWREVWEPFRIDPTPDSVWGHAYVDSRRGVSEIFGSTYGKRDNNAANMVVDVFGRWEGSTYYFPKPPVPMSVLENPDEIYKYERRRMTRLDGQTRLYELFMPNEHISRNRFYMLAGYVLRHEQLDEKGKVKRIITLDDWRQPRPGPKPDFDDKLLPTSAPLLMAHQVYHRVYEVDANGRPRLVALSWNRSVRNPLKKTPLDMADLVFGTPDGKVKWKNREEFNKAFDTSENARQVFPHSSVDDEEDGE